MTTYTAELVRISSQVEGLQRLTSDIRSARARAYKSLPGDRVDVLRFEALSTQLERLALLARADETRPSIQFVLPDCSADGFYDAANIQDLPPGTAEARIWIAAGDVAVVLLPNILPDEAALTIDAVPPVATTWNAPLDADGVQLNGGRAVAARFREQLDEAVGGIAGSALRPSGVSNSVLTEGLHGYVAGNPSKRIAVPVIYKDGSRGPDFPFRCLSFGAEPAETSRTYRFAMLSIRHTEMDVEVDGAWLRNSEISRRRPAGETDRIAYELSVTQLDALSNDGHITIYLYQTGLDAALIGIYRAITEHLLASPKSLTVVPFYFRQQRPGHAGGRTVAGYEQQTSFQKSRNPWTC